MRSAVVAVASVSNGVAMVHVDGEITDDAMFPKVDATAHLVRVNLKALRRINSAGVRQWLSFVSTLSPQAKIIFEQCPAVFISQVNMIKGFLGTGSISSVIAPYYCAACAEPREIEFSREQLTGIRDVAPERPCPSCKSAMEFDDVPEIYFAFMSGDSNHP